MGYVHAPLLSLHSLHAITVLLQSSSSSTRLVVVEEEEEEERGKDG
jgi:hypothetical protein